MQIKAIKGVKDILPSNIHYWQLIESTAKDIFSRFCFDEIKIPIIEKTDLFVKSIGDVTDIVEKEMYSFEDKSGGNITLRPEGTASVVRAFIEHKLYTNLPVTKLFYFGPMFRRERPQAGRYRQFYQLGAEALGAANPLIDAEIIFMLVEFFKKLNLKDLDIQINSLGCKDCRHKFREALHTFIENKLATLCEDCNRRFQRNPLRVLDCKQKGCHETVINAPVPLDYVCKSCLAHHEKLKELLTDAEVSFSLNQRLVRGLDYYTSTAFEIIDTSLGAQNAVAGGGRYDNLVERFDGPQTPAIGFAIGVDRLVSLLEKKETNKVPETCKVFFIALGDIALKKSFDLTCMLRQEGITIERSYEQSSMKSQMRKANRHNARYTLILGEDEVSEKKITVKDMKEGKQEQIALDEVVNYIKTNFMS